MFILTEKISLERCLSRGQNNIDLIRLIAASLVIYGHSFALIPNDRYSDLVYRFTGTDAAEAGVKTFFFLSGLLVVNSIISGKESIPYIVKRATRIWPALIFVVLVTAYVIGPLFTNTGIPEYFSGGQVHDYVRKMLSFQIWGNSNMALPGLFSSNPVPGVVNAPLWTLVVEVYAYAMILALFLVGAFNKPAAIFVFALFIADALLPFRLVFWWLPKDNPDFAYIPFCFAIGGVCAIYKDKIKISLGLVVGLLILCFLLKGWEYHTYLTYITMFALAIYVAALPAIANMPRIPDISYGLYLWGWPIQQLVISQFPGLNFWLSLTLAFVFAALMAFISWHLVEKGAIRFGHKLASRLKSLPSRSTFDAVGPAVVVATDTDRTEA